MNLIPENILVNLVSKYFINEKGGILSKSPYQIGKMLHNPLILKIY